MSLPDIVGRAAIAGLGLEDVFSGALTGFIGGDIESKTGDFIIADNERYGKLESVARQFNFCHLTVLEGADDGADIDVNPGVLTLRNNALPKLLSCSAGEFGQVKIPDFRGKGDFSVSPALFQHFDTVNGDDETGKIADIVRGITDQELEVAADRLRDAVYGDRRWDGGDNRRD